MVSSDLVEGAFTASVAGLVSGGEAVIRVGCAPGYFIVVVDGGYWPEQGWFPSIHCQCLVGIFLLCGGEIVVLMMGCLGGLTLVGNDCFGCHPGFLCRFPPRCRRC